MFFNRWGPRASYLTMIGQNSELTMTGETPEVRSDKRKPREKKEIKRERKDREKREKRFSYLFFFYFFSVFSFFYFFSFCRSVPPEFLRSFLSLKQMSMIE